MALSHAQAAHSDGGTVVTGSEEPCIEVAAGETEGQALSGHEACDCGLGADCSCNCLFSLYAIAHLPPLQALRPRSGNEAVPLLSQVLPSGPSRLFRPPRV